MAEVVRIAVREDWKTGTNITDVGAFRSWFFSDQFEQRVTESSGGFSIKIPFTGFRVLSFGADKSDAEAWTKRSTEANSQNWDFRKAVVTSAARSGPVPNTPQILLALAELCGSNRTNDRFTYDATVTNNDASITVRFTPVIDLERGVVLPTLRGIDCSSTLTCSRTHPSLNKKMSDQGTIFQATWANQSAVDGFFTIVTTQGSQRFDVTRPVSKATVVYELEQPRDEVVASRAEVLDMPDIGQNSCDGPFRGQIGKTVGEYTIGCTDKWIKTTRTRSYSLSKGTRFSNPTIDCVSIACSTHSDKAVSLSADLKSVAAAVTTSGPGGTWQIRADEIGPVPHDTTIEYSAAFSGATLNTTIPKIHTKNHRLLVRATPSGDAMRVDLPQAPGSQAPVRCTVKQDNAAIVEYECVRVAGPPRPPRDPNALNSLLRVPQD